MSKHFTTTARIALMASTALLLPQAAFAQDTATGGEVAVDEQDEQTTIVVTGFRESLNAAIAAKRESVSQVDVIVAEDIAKFPDTNLAESLQRIPGVAIERDAGEGRAITVRGLGAQFTRVRVNGMETIATSTDGASANRDRGFDFNIFASELFNSIVVHKTASAALDEGSLGAVIDLNTGNPLGYGAGTTLVGSAQARYNDLNDDVSPRVAGLFAWNNADETFGVSASAAWTKYETAELGNNSVRWAAAEFQSVDGVDCTANPADPGCVEVAEAFHPRIPRYGLVNHERERLGITGAIQFRPSEDTDIEINALYSNFKEGRDEYWGEVLLRSNEDEIDLSNYTIDGDNNIISAELDNAWVRNERYHRESETEFYQISGRLDQRFGDLTVGLRGGFSKSDADIPVETSLMFDDRDAQDYAFDYSDMKSPLLVFGTSVTDPTNFQLAEFRDRPSNVTNRFKTIALDLGWEASDALTFSGGPFYRQFEFETIGWRRDGVYCSVFTCVPGQYGAPVTADLAELFELGDAGQPDGNTNSWVVPDLDAATAFIDLYGMPAVLDQGGQRSVTEKVTGGYVQADWDTMLGDIRTTGNLGLRYARTDQSSQGFVSGEYVTVERDYEDWLPALNLNIFPADNFIIRGAVAKVVTRPTLGSLTPGGSVDQFNFRITTGNPMLEPYRAWNYDLSFEWYFAPGAIASIALFAKDIESFPIGDSLQITWAESGLPTSLLTPGTPVHDAIVNGTDPNREFEYRTTINGEGAQIKGIEFGLNLPFSVFTETLSDFGVLGNVTYVDSKADSTFGSQTFTRSFFGVSDWSANGTAYYDNGRFSVRISGAYRSGYITGRSGNGNIYEGFDPSFNLDASIRYKVTDNVELTLDGNNLTDQYRHRWTDDFARRNYENNHFGRVFMAGVRVQM